MDCDSPGILPGSEFYFATPSALARSLFYHVLAAGSYVCACGYRVQRERYDSFLLMEILDGECVVQCGGETCRAHAGELVLLNCYRPHAYGAETHLRMRWLHFDGGQSAAFFEALSKARGPVLPCDNPALFSESLESILAVLREGRALSEPTVSCLIHTLLCNLVAATTDSGAMEPGSPAVGEAIRYMREGYSRRLTVDEIARAVSVSPSHFSRLFRRETGSSPYEYLLNLRLDNAKSLLKKTGLSVAEIAERTGFASQSNFICAFHARVGLSPARFRTMRF